MKRLYTFLVFSVFGLISHAQTYTLTYNSGDIRGVSDVQQLGDTSQCPGILTITNIPIGQIIDSVNLAYDFFSTRAGFQSIFEQVSYVTCNGTSETQTYTPPAQTGLAPTIWSYNRTVTVFNRTVNGPLTFKLQAGTTSLLGGSCTGGGHYVLNNTWVVTIYTHAGAVTVCNPPSNLVDSAKAVKSAWLKWTPGGNETQWRVYYRKSISSGNYDSVTVSNTPRVQLTNLDSMTSYVAQVRALCSSISASGLSAHYTFITDTPACPAASVGTFTAVNATNATLRWVAGGTETAWDLQWGNNGFTLGSGTNVRVTNTPSYAVSGLTQGQTYQFYVRSDCNFRKGAWSGPYTFRSTAAGVENMTNTLTAYPNPTSGNLVFNSTVLGTYLLVDSKGSIVQKGTATVGNNELNLEKLPEGIYLLKVGIASVKVIKQ